jgi:hypothetical protein
MKFRNLKNLRKQRLVARFLRAVLCTVMLLGKAIHAIERNRGKRRQRHQKGQPHAPFFADLECPYDKGEPNGEKGYEREGEEQEEVVAQQVEAPLQAAKRCTKKKNGPNQDIPGFSLPLTCVAKCNVEKHYRHAARYHGNGEREDPEHELDSARKA